MSNDKHVFDKALLWASGGGGFFVVDQLYPGNNIVTNSDTNNEYRTIAKERYFYGSQFDIEPHHEILIGHHWPTDILDKIIVNKMVVIKPGFITELLLFIKRMTARPDTIPNSMWLIRMINRIENKTMFEDWNNFGHSVEVMHFTKSNAIFNSEFKDNQVNNMMYLFFFYCRSRGLVYTIENFPVFIEAMYRDHGYFKLQTDHSLLNNSSHPNIKNIDILEYEEVFHTDYDLFGIDNDIKKQYAEKNKELMRKMLGIKNIGNKLNELQ
tara:strand:+ start:2334 stop:3137 length:804 start_codon:yes stop_codon:yes gene_type:complete